MGAEPTLYEGDLDVDGWVETLQLALRRAGQHPEVDGKFGNHTKAAVIAFQREHDLQDNGVVGNETWSVLMERDREPPGTNNPPHGGLHPKHQAHAEPAAPAPQIPAAGPSHPHQPLPGNPYAGTEWAEYWDQGWVAGFANPDPSIQPPWDMGEQANSVWLEGAWAAQTAARQATGNSPIPGVERDDPSTPADPLSLPSFRLPIPDAELGHVHLDTGAYILEITFGLRGGNITVDPPNALPGVSLDPSGYRFQVQSQLEGLLSGIRINGVAGVPPSSITIGTTWGNQFVSSEVRLVTPTKLMFIGQANLPDMALPTDAGDGRLRGQFGFYATVEVFPHPQPVPVDDDVPWYEAAWDWVGDHAGEILVGAVVVGAVLIVPEAAPGILRLAPSL